jgi:sugar fermentation stimulation protein A
MTGGVYAAVWRLERARAVRVGRLGRFRLEPGFYVYVGSAQRGLAARLARHARRTKPLRWHADYLARHATWVGAWTWPLGKDAECRLARALAALDGLDPAVPRFGASDCRCPTHLFRAASRPALAGLCVDGRTPAPWPPAEASAAQE